MSDVNNYYLRLPECIFRVELESGLITLHEVQELCAKKYIQPHITDKNLLVTPLTEEELGAVLLKFPDLNMKPMPVHSLSPMVQRLSDPDGMGATPTHQAEVHKIDADIWGPKDSRSGEIPLPVPFREPKRVARGCEKGMLDVEGRAVHKGSRQKKCQDGSMGSTAPISTPAMRSPWSRTTSGIDEEDLYPAEHPFICVLKDSDDLEETLYAATTTGFPLYKGSYRTLHNTVLLGFKQNDGDHFISFPIKGPNGNAKQAEYVQVILHPTSANPGNPCRDCRDCRYCRHHSDLVVDL